MALIVNPVITLATAADVRELMAISTITFTDTYAQVNTVENMQNYIRENFSEAATKKQLQEPGTEFYLVKLEEQTAGYLKLNSGKAQTELKQANTIEIERIYVLKKFQGKGIGKLLIDKTIEIAAQRRLDYLWLGVWENNLAALGFYKQMGFIEFDRHIFMLGNDEQKDIMMKLDLQHN